MIAEAAKDIPYAFQALIAATLLVGGFLVAMVAAVLDMLFDFYSGTLFAVASIMGVAGAIFGCGTLGYVAWQAVLK